MKLIAISLLLCFLQVPLFAQQRYKDTTLPIEKRVDDLLSQMTVQEKVGQLCSPLGWEMYAKGDNLVEVSDKFITLMNEVQPGTFWATLRADPWTRKTLSTGLNPELAAEALNKLQKYAVEETRLGIPLFFAEECAHGHMAIGATVFPTSIGQASTWNKHLIEEMASVISLETRLQGGHIAYGPVLDLARDPRWSRVEETFGEDPVLTGILGSAFVKGLQGSDFTDGKHTYSTLKHFAAYGIPAGGHNGQKSIIGMRELFSDHLLPFRMAVEAGTKTVMTSYNSIDGVPATAHSYLINDVLKQQWGFDGFLFSDLGSVEGIATTHRVAPNIKTAASMALNAGVEIDLGGNAYGNNLAPALEEGLISEQTLNKAVSNVLRLKFEMGLFENPYVSTKKAKEIVGSATHKTIARKVAQESVVLLKNKNNILPLSKEVKSIAIIGPNADNGYNQLGDYTAPQNLDEVSTLLRGVKEAVSPNTIVRYAKGCAIRDTTEYNIDEAVEITKNSDVTILVLGGSSARDFKTEYIDTGAAQVSSSKSDIISDMESGEGYDRSTLKLLGLQEKLLSAVLDTGKPVIVIYIQGRPLDMNIASQRADALLTAWYPGQEGGNGIADVIFGDYNPSGRLPISIPRSVGQLPVYYSLGKQSSYVEEPSTPLYPFGYGLSYANFEYSNLSIEQFEESVNISCKVSNTGGRDGDEVVQLYIRDKVSSVYTPPIQLKDFEKTFIPQGESKTVTFKLTPLQLSLYNIAMEEEVEPGEFSVMIGSSSDDIRLRGSFTID